MNKLLKVASTCFAIILGVSISRCVKYQAQMSRPVEIESIPAGYSYEGRFAGGKDYYSKLIRKNSGVVEISGYRINRYGEAREGIPYAVDCQRGLRRWEGEWAAIEKDSLAEAFRKRYC